MLYLTARRGDPNVGDAEGGGNLAIALMAILGATAPKEVTINELTTVASVWTGAQFLKGETLSGHALGLKIASASGPYDITVRGNDHIWVANELRQDVDPALRCADRDMPARLQDGRPNFPTPKPTTLAKACNRVANNIDLMDETCLTKVPDETASTRCGGNGRVVFCGLAKPVLTPAIGSGVRGC